MKKKHSIFIIVFAIIAIIAIVLMRQIITNKGANVGGGQRGAAIPVETVSITTRPMQEIRDFNGTVKAAHTYVVSTKVSGRLLSINKRIGDRVSANEIIGRIDDIEYKTALDDANMQLAHIQTELNRARELQQKGIVSKAEFDALNTQYQSQKARRDLAQTTFENTYIRAAEEGFVAQRHIDGGALLSVGSPVITVVGIDSVFVDISVSERDYKNISTGKKATVRTEAVPNQIFDAKVHRVAPFFQAGSRTAAVEIALKNSKHLLKPGMSARINVILDEDKNAKVIPSGALIEKDGKQSVFIVNDSLKAELIPVETGIYDGKFVQILSPEIDKPVVFLGHHLLKDGSNVRIISEREN
ncbi:MAG: efflux RND transporter periplasmic adaptor subunit [Clostridiales bacterium]|jgi:RND family efflux transporter MFP subunit|nr:efflux RND transporter periplasmic adaptor subunit [Clostridiales bacterium]